jgi:uroporphyrinogen-III synthase
VRVLITRPRPAAMALAARLVVNGHEAVIEPLLTIVPDPDGPARLLPALAGARAVIFTSTNGVTSFATATERRDLPAFAVGAGTAAAARDVGFTEIHNALGDVEALTALVAAGLKPEDGALVHASGHVIAGDLAGRLTRFGFTVRSVPLYQAIAADALGDDTVAAFRAAEIDAALFFSPRTAATFVRLARAAGIERHCTTTVGVALSPAVAAELRGLGWRKIMIAELPTEDAVLKAVDRLDAEMRGSGALNP